MGFNEWNFLPMDSVRRNYENYGIIVVTYFGQNVNSFLDDIKRFEEVVSKLADNRIHYPELTVEDRALLLKRNKKYLSQLYEIKGALGI